METDLDRIDAMKIIEKLDMNVIRIRRTAFTDTDMQWSVRYGEHGPASYGKTPSAALLALGRTSVKCST